MEVLSKLPFLVILLLLPLHLSFCFPAQPNPLSQVSVRVRPSPVGTALLSLTQGLGGWSLTFLLTALSGHYTLFLPPGPRAPGLLSGAWVVGVLGDSTAGCLTCERRLCRHTGAEAAHAVMGDEAG